MTNSSKKYGSHTSEEDSDYDERSRREKGRDLRNERPEIQNSNQNDDKRKYDSDDNKTERWKVIYNFDGYIYIYIYIYMHMHCS